MIFQWLYLLLTTSWRGLFGNAWFGKYTHERRKHIPQPKVPRILSQPISSIYIQWILFMHQSLFCGSSTVTKPFFRISWLSLFFFQRKAVIKNKYCYSMFHYLLDKNQTLGCYALVLVICLQNYQSVAIHTWHNGNGIHKKSCKPTSYLSLECLTSTKEQCKSHR